MRRIVAAAVVLLPLLVSSAFAQLSTGLTVQRAGQAPHMLSLSDIAALHAITQRAAVEHTERTWTGPLLWDVLVAAGAAEPDKPADAVHHAVRVIGADGWVAVFGLAELSPEFAGRSIELADRMNDVPISGPGLRLIVPGERRGGRSVRDVVRVEVD